MLPNTLATDRILVLGPMEGKKPLSTGGLADPRLFTGENRLHAIKDPATCMWYLKYEMGIRPEEMKQMFTTFSALKKFAERYYAKRNIEIKEIKD